MEVTLESQRLKLVPPSLAFVDVMYDVIKRNCDSLSQFLPWVASDFSTSDLAANIEQAAKNYEQFSGEFLFNLVEKETNCFIGALGFIVRDVSVPYIELGYWLDPEKTGCGYISEAIKRIERYAFIEKKVKRIEIKMAGSNTKSQAVAERCGYLFEGQLENARRLPYGQIDSTRIYAKTV